MEYHEISNIWPLLEGEDLDALALDIAAHGLIHPILTYEGKILDGRNRDRACIEAGVEPRYVVAAVKTDKEAINLVVSLNQHRRHMSLEQRAFAAAKIANLQLGSNQYDERREGVSRETPSSMDSGRTIAASAEQMNVSVASTKRARAILANGTPEDVKAVLKGKSKLKKKAEEVLNRKPETAKRAKHQRRPAKAPDTPPTRPLDGLGPVRALTREQVDPEFTGTGMEFTAKYGHVILHTAEERARNRFGDWANGLRLVAKAISTFPAWPDVDLNWLRSPKPRDVEKMTEAVQAIRATLETAEAMLGRAQEAAAHKANGDDSASRVNARLGHDQR